MIIEKRQISRTVNQLIEIVEGKANSTISSIEMTNPNDENVTVEVWLGGAEPAARLMEVLLAPGHSILYHHGQGEGRLSRRAGGCSPGRPGIRRST